MPFSLVPDKDLDPLEANEIEVDHFLVELFSKGFSYKTENCYRLAVATVHSLLEGLTGRKKSFDM